MSHLKAGVCRVDITPPIGVYLQGYGGREKPGDGIHDRLFAKILVLKDEHTSLLIVTADLISFSPEFMEKIRIFVKNNTKIPERNILICASHTHSGPITMNLRGMGKADKRYLDLMERIVSDGILSAIRKLRDVKIGFAKGSVEGIGYVREGENKGKASPDPELGVIKICDVSDNLMAIVVNYTCHPVILGCENLKISADYPGTLQSFVESKTNCLCLFTQGACGDIDPVTNKQRWGSGTFKDLESVGKTIGKAVLKLLDMVKFETDSTIKVKGKTIKLPFQKAPDLREAEKEVSEAELELEKARKRKQFFNINEAEVTLRWAKERLKLIKENKYPQCMPCEVQIVEVGRIILVGVSGEVFSEIGLKIKERLGRGNTFFIGYANGNVGYIPTEKAFKTCEYACRNAAKWYGLPPFDPKIEEVILREICSH